MSVLQQGTSWIADRTDTFRRVVSRQTPEAASMLYESENSTWLGYRTTSVPVASLTLAANFCW
jgi:hypothetical protein